ncbi:cell wall metabolism sensor histidine kinase WalK [Fusobacterium sp. FSA-380-WT-2B]|uniref:sensor histidine kinase n=1 Tax=Fusobacterium sp. FSA-380-WT-2B TaxID=2605786 RepID=UPI0012B30143|nr:HAMP domain-containing sensor histidine kinase [Fusobacterium sp. FSA-380-WT-2B]MSS60116.1 HAMP domain-containing histidine kinase [Fusobacterium sp. FSA-380-WT-2B]
MKKLSYELMKSYRNLIILFSISYMITMLFFSSYIKNAAYLDIEVINGFINYEMNGIEEKLKKGENFEEIFLEALEECPKIQGITVIFKNTGKYYSYDLKEEFINLLNETNIYEEIQSLGFYKYEFLNKKIEIDGKNTIEILIIKDMKEDRKIILSILEASFVLIFITIITSIVIAKRFYNKIIPPLENLRDITNKVNLENMNYKLESKNNFVEFNSIINSYNNMLKRLQSQTEAQINFVNSASHEMKTPIFIISGYINLIKRWGIENKDIVIEALNSIEEETKNMYSLISKLLFLAKDDYDEKENKNFNISKAITEIINDLKIIYPNQKINFSSKKSFINSDYHLIRQLFLNLIENAIKYGRDKEIYINIRENKNIIVDIIDNGEGISQENLKHIFDRFFRVDKARSREMKSHGLGLSIVKKIVETLNIDLDIRSELNKGTIVTLTLPLK